MKGKVIVIKRRGPVSGLPRCGRAYERTGSQQFNSGNLPRRESNATTGGGEGGERTERRGGVLVANMLEVSLIEPIVDICGEFLSSGAFLVLLGNTF